MFLCHGYKRLTSKHVCPSEFGSLAPQRLILSRSSRPWTRLALARIIFHRQREVPTVDTFKLSLMPLGRPRPITYDGQMRPNIIFFLGLDDLPVTHSFVVPSRSLAHHTSLGRLV